MKKNKMRLMTAVVLAAGVLSLSGCQTQANETVTTAATEETVTESPAAESPTAESLAAESPAAESETRSETQAEIGTETLLGTFQTITLDGEEIDQDIFSQAGLSMINIWGTFCPPCIREMPDLAELSHEYGGEQFQMIGLVSDVMDAGNAGAVEIIEQTGADYTHILISQELYDNYLYNIQVVPTTVFVDKDGRPVGDVYTGAKSKQQWETIIKGLLAETGE